ncbi:MAG: hypothetical protein ABI379_07520 [Rhodanobacter sp.]
MLQNNFISAMAIIVTTLAASVAPVPANAVTLSPTCKTVLDANDRQYTTPVHLYMTRAGVTHESLVFGDAMYIKVKDTWRRSPMAPKDMLEIRQEAIKEAKSLDCEHLRDEAVDGEAAAVYSMSSVSDDGDHADGQIWISKSRNVPLKSEMDVGSGAEKKHTSIRYDYNNVQAPAGVK